MHPLRKESNNLVRKALKYHPQGKRKTGHPTNNKRYSMLEELKGVGCLWERGGTLTRDCVGMAILVDVLQLYAPLGVLRIDDDDDDDDYNNNDNNDDDTVDKSTPKKLKCTENLCDWVTTDCWLSVVLCIPTTLSSIPSLLWKSLAHPSPLPHPT